jgi:hypothetical protein
MQIHNIQKINNQENKNVVNMSNANNNLNNNQTINIVYPHPFNIVNF